MLHLIGTCFAALFGLEFGSFANVCLTRWPEDESIVLPGSHCRNCNRPLAWYENIPLASWIALRGRCRTCHARISWHYPIVELAVGVTWAVIGWQASQALFAPEASTPGGFEVLVAAVGKMVLCWLLILLAALDAKYFWLPDRLTLSGSALGLPFALVRFGVRWSWPPAPSKLAESIESNRALLSSEFRHWLLGLVIAPAIILLVRWSYRLFRKREGIGLGDAKLMLLLAVWLGLAHILVAFVIGVFLGTGFALLLLVVPQARRDNAAAWHLNRLPLGTFLSVGGILSALWGTPMIVAYLRAVGL